MAGLSCASIIVLVSLAAGLAQERATPPSTDPRVGLKAGFHNAGEAARNMEVIASLPKPEGFFDPKTPAGAPIAAERAPTRRPAPASRIRPTPTPMRLADPASAWCSASVRSRPGESTQLRQPDLAFSAHGLRRQLSRVQHLRYRARRQAQAGLVGGVPRRSGRRVGPRPSPDHVGGADARAARLRRRACRLR